MCIVVRSLVFRRKPNFASKCPWALGGGHAYQNSHPNSLCAIHLERVYAQKEEIVAIEWPVYALIAEGVKIQALSVASVTRAGDRISNDNRSR